MSRKKLWVVTMSTEMVVYAEDTTEAIEVAVDNAEEVTWGLEARAARAVHSMDDLPSPVEDVDLFAYGGPDDLTIGQLLDSQNE